MQSIQNNNSLFSTNHAQDGTLKDADYVFACANYDEIVKEQEEEQNFEECLAQNLENQGCTVIDRGCSGLHNLRGHKDFAGLNNKEDFFAVIVFQSKEKPNLKELLEKIMKDSGIKGSAVTPKDMAEKTAWREKPLLSVSQLHTNSAREDTPDSSQLSREAALWSQLSREAALWSQLSSVIDRIEAPSKMNYVEIGLDVNNLMPRNTAFANNDGKIMMFNKVYGDVQYMINRTYEDSSNLMPAFAQLSNENVVNSMLQNIKRMSSDDMVKKFYIVYGKHLQLDIANAVDAVDAENAANVACLWCMCVMQDFGERGIMYRRLNSLLFVHQMNFSRFDSLGDRSIIQAATKMYVYCKAVQDTVQSMQMRPINTFNAANEECYCLQCISEKLGFKN